jgi:hypothetical protein
MRNTSCKEVEIPGADRQGILAALASGCESDFVSPQ